MKKIDKTPSMPFYGKDFYDAEEVRLMSLAAQGLYVALLWRQWMEGSIPADARKLALLVSCGDPSTIQKLWTSEVAPMFEEFEDGRLRNPKLEEHRERLRKERERKSEGARKTNSKRWSNESLSDQSATGNPIAKRSLSDQGATGNPIATRVADANAKEIALVSDLPEEGAGETIAEGMDFAALKIVVEAYPEGRAPSIGILDGWVKTLGSAEEVAAIIRRYPLKPVEYLDRCIESAVLEKRFPRPVLTKPLDRSAESSLHVGAAPACTDREAMLALLDQFRADNGLRPKESRPDDRQAWEQRFVDRFGFTPDQWNNANDDQVKAFHAALNARQRTA